MSTEWTPEEVRAAIRMMTADDHAEGRHDLVELSRGTCPECDRRTGHYETRRVNVCTRPEAGTLVTRRVWVEL